MRKRSNEKNISSQDGKREHILNDSTLTRKTFSGMFWKFAERILAQLVSTIVAIELARILVPEDYAVVMDMSRSTTSAAAPFRMASGRNLCPSAFAPLIAVNSA